MINLLPKHTIAFADSVTSSYRALAGYSNDLTETQDAWAESLDTTHARLQEDDTRYTTGITPYTKFLAKNFVSWHVTNSTNTRYTNQRGYLSPCGERVQEFACEDWKIHNQEADENKHFLIYKIDTELAKNLFYRYRGEQENAVYVSEVNKYENDDGSVYYSKLPKNIIDYFGSCLDLTSFESIDLAPSLGQVRKEIFNRQNSYYRVDKFASWKNASFNVGQIGDISFTDADSVIPTIDGNQISFANLISTTPGNINVIQLDSLYRGGGGKVSYSKKQSRISHLYNKKNIFLYAAHYTVLNHETLSWEKVKVINIMVTIPIAQAFKYKRARDFFPIFFKNIYQRDGLMLTNPDEYYRIIREKFGRNMTYWDGLK